MAETSIAMSGWTGSQIVEAARQIDAKLRTLRSLMFALQDIGNGMEHHAELLRDKTSILTLLDPSDHARLVATRDVMISCAADVRRITQKYTV